MFGLEKKHINPVIATWSYSKIMRECGEDAEQIAQIMGVKKPSKKSKKED
jgi:hypothetical protein